MSLNEWIISMALILVVLRQLHGKKLTMIGLLWPIPFVAWGALEYGTRVPSFGSDWGLVGACAATGLLLGMACGALTEVYLEAGSIMARARWFAALLWTLGMSARLVFGLVATNSDGQEITELSQWIGLHDANTWATALITMALCEVLARTSVLFVRARRLRAAAMPSPSHPSPPHLGKIIHK